MSSSIAKVNILHDILTSKGWLSAGLNVLDFEEAKRFASSGHLEILTVDGEAYVYAPCCSQHKGE